MAERPKPTKARIVKVDDPSKFVDCQFNPQDFSITWNVKWTSETKKGKDAASITYAGGEAQDLTVPLLFDTTDTGQDVRDTYGVLLELASVDPKSKHSKTDLGEPSRCRFTWGRFLAFTAVITKITQKFIMFKLDGTPLRAEVSVTFKQIDKAVKPQNPTSRSEARKIHVVHEGDRLDWIAWQEYGDPAQWRHIAETNDLMDPFDLHPGQVLKLVPLK